MLYYNETILKHFRNPQNQGKLDNPTVIGQAGNPVCGDVMKLYLDIQDNQIKDIKFETLGCAAAIASSSVLTSLARGKTLEEAGKITKDDVVKELGDVPAQKIHCSLLAVDALKNALEEYKK